MITLLLENIKNNVIIGIWHYLSFFVMKKQAIISMKIFLLLSIFRMFTTTHVHDSLH